MKHEVWLLRSMYMNKMLKSYFQIISLKAKCQSKENVSGDGDRPWTIRTIEY